MDDHSYTHFCNCESCLEITRLIKNGKITLSTPKLNFEQYIEEQRKPDTGKGFELSNRSTVDQVAEQWRKQTITLGESNGVILDKDWLDNLFKRYEESNNISMYINNELLGDKIFMFNKKDIYFIKDENKLIINIKEVKKIEIKEDAEQQEQEEKKNKDT